MPTHIYTLIDFTKRKEKRKKEKKTRLEKKQLWGIKGYNQETCKNDDVLLCV